MVHKKKFIPQFKNKLKIDSRLFLVNKIIENMTNYKNNWMKSAGRIII